MPDDVVVDLAGAEDEPVDLPLGLVVQARIVDDLAEPPVCELVDVRRRLLQPQETLRREDDERPRLRVERLAAEDMEVLGGGRAVDDADVLLRGELHEALEPGARVLRAVSLVAVRQEEGEPRVWPHFERPDTMNWSTITWARVDEVAELRLPDDERRGQATE